MEERKSLRAPQGVRKMEDVIDTINFCLHWLKKHPATAGFIFGFIAATMIYVVIF